MIDRPQGLPEDLPGPTVDLLESVKEVPTQGEPDNGTSEFKSVKEAASHPKEFPKRQP